MNTQFQVNVLVLVATVVGLCVGFFAAWLGFQERLENSANAIEELNKFSSLFGTQASDHDGDGHNERWAVTVGKDEWPEFRVVYYDDDRDGIPDAYLVRTVGWRDSGADQQQTSRLEELLTDQDEDGSIDRRSVLISEDGWAAVNAVIDYAPVDGLPQTAQVSIAPPDRGSAALSFGAAKDFPDYPFFLCFITPPAGAPRRLYRDLNLDGVWDMMSVEGFENGSVWYQGVWVEAVRTDLPIANSPFYYNELVGSGEMVYFVDGLWKLKE